MTDTTQRDDYMLTYRYPRSMAEVIARYPCAGAEAVAIHGPYRRLVATDDRITVAVVLAVLIGLGIGIVRGMLAQ
jgi:hypothetical protein